MKRIIMFLSVLLFVGANKLISAEKVVVKSPMLPAVNRIAT